VDQDFGFAAAAFSALSMAPRTFASAPESFMLPTKKLGVEFAPV
jgi:hypothetical protein